MEVNEETLNHKILGLRMRDVEKRCSYSNRKVYLAFAQSKDIGFQSERVQMAWVREEPDKSWYQMSCWFDAHPKNWDYFCCGKTSEDWKKCRHSKKFVELKEFYKQEYPEYFQELRNIWKEV